ISRHLSLESIEDTATGTLRLSDPTACLASWRYTARCFVTARRLAAQFEVVRSGSAREHGSRATQPTILPSLPRPASSGARQDRPPTATPILLRLLRLGRPWWRMVLLGGVLSMASTAAGLIPPYLTMPLLDDVLIPFQNG